MNHPAPHTKELRSVRAAAAGLAVLMITAHALLPAIQGAGAVPARIGVLVFLDDSDYRWADVGPEAGSTALCATTAACRQLGLSLNYTMSEYGAFVTDIGGLDAPADFSWWWYLLLWNASRGAWQEASVGAGELRLSAGDNVCWCPNSSAPPVPNPLMKYPWPSFRGNPGNTGIAPVTAYITHKVVWTADLANGPVDTTPAAADGRVFISTGGVYNWTTMTYDQPPHLYSLDATSGEQLWSAVTSAAGWQVSSPAVHNGRVVIGTSDGRVLAFSEATGSPLWSFAIGASPTGVTASPVATAEGVYIAAGDGRLYALSPEGNEMWEFPLGGPAYMSTPALSGGRLFAGTDNGTFWCVAINGTPIWNFSTEGKIRCSPVVSGGNVYVIETMYDGWTATRSVLHVLQSADGQPVSPAVDLPATTSSPVVDNGWIYLGDSSGLRAYMANGTQGWAAPTEGPVQSSPVRYGNELLFTDNSRNGTLHTCTVSYFSGNAPWNFTPEPRQYILGSPAIADCLLYFGSDNGKVYCIGMKDVSRPGPGTAGTGLPSEAQPLSVALLASAAIIVAYFVRGAGPRRWRHHE